MPRLIVVDDMSAIPNPSAHEDNIDEWLVGLTTIKNMLAANYKLYDGPADYKTAELNLIEDRMNDFEYCLAVSKDGNAYSQQLIRKLINVLSELNANYYISLVEILDWPDEPPFYIAINAHRVYCIAKQSNCIAELGLDTI